MENSICTVEQLKNFIELSPKEEKKLKQITNKHQCVLLHITCH